MTVIKTRILVAPDGTLSGRARDLPPGEHDADITIPEVAGRLAECSVDDLLARVRSIQAEIAQLPVLDSRSPEEIIGYNKRGNFA